MEVCKRKNERIVPTIIWTNHIILFVSLLCHYPSDAHFIQIDHNEFRTNGIPRSGIPLPIIEQHLPPPSPPSSSRKEVTPVEFVVDLTNDLTYRLLHYHSILNRNNFAFSPTALMSILVALYEGSTGRSALELKNVLQFPNNKDILRVGYRDIHRRLRTYFFGSENPLKGLSLNKDNVTIVRDYENILMFYGYDLGMDMVSSVATTPTTTTTSSTTEMSATAPITPMELTATSTPISTTNDPKTTTSEGTTLPTTMPISTTTSSETTTTTEISTTTTEEITTTISTTEISTTEAAQTTETTIPAETEAVTESTTESPTTIESTTESEARSGDEAVEFISTGTGEQFLRLQKARVTRLPSGRLQAPPRPQAAARKQVANRSKSLRLTEKNSTTSTIRNDYLPATSRTFQSERISIHQQRPKRHLLGSFKEADANLFVTLFHPQSQSQVQHNPFGLTGLASGSSLSHVHEFEVEIEPQFITGPSSPGSPPEHKQNYNTDIISHIFYLGGQEIIYTTYKVYNAVLYYKYFDHLKMSVLELELDTPEYNLMILLPDYHIDMVAAAASLNLGPTLRLLRKQLKPRWVQAIIPDFKLNGAMFLTNDLQNLGICDIFEPNRADFRPMTDEKGIYVKHIEQSINVNIRTHPINQLRRNYGAAQLHPIQISVNHPFLFFIIDRDLDVAVMAGRILNPLNVRIQ